MKKLRKMKNQKGFTLVEVIVVLVILAIMAAILIPSLVGYIDKARENSATTETRSIVQAVQTLASENYAKDKTITKATLGTSTGVLGGELTIGYGDIKKLSEASQELSDSNLKVKWTGAEGTEVEGVKISILEYQLGDVICQYKDGKYTKVNGFSIT